METKQYTEGSTNVTLIIGAVLLLAIAAFIFSTQVAPPQTIQNDTAEAQEELQQVETSEETSGTEPVANVPEPAVEIEATTDLQTTPVAEDTTVPAVETVAKAGIFTEYDESLLANAEDGAVILFFHASWCPSCRTLENNVNKNLEDIPSGVTILKLDYDSETELKKKYGVVRQHTLVQVDRNGNEIKKLTGLTNTLDQVVNQL